MMDTRTKIILGVAILYVCASLMSIWWVTHATNVAGKTLAEYTQVIADKIAQDQTYSELKKLVSETEAEREQLATYVLSESNTITFLADIEAVSVKKGVDLTIDSLDVAVTKGDFDNLVIPMSITGDAQLVQHMIEVLEKIPYHSHLESLHFSRASNASDATLRVTLVVSIEKT